MYYNKYKVYNRNNYGGAVVINLKMNKKLNKNNLNKSLKKYYLIDYYKYFNDLKSFKEIYYSLFINYKLNHNFNKKISLKKGYDYNIIKD